MAKSMHKISKSPAERDYHTNFNGTELSLGQIHIRNPKGLAEKNLICQTCAKVLSVYSHEIP